MATRSLIQLRGLFEDLVSGSRSIAPLDLQNNTPPQSETQAVLASGLNTIVIPALSRGVIIIFDPTSTVTKTLKGVTGDTGIVLRKDSWHVLGFEAAPPADFVINASAVDTGKYTRFIFF